MGFGMSKQSNKDASPTTAKETRTKQNLEEDYGKDYKLVDSAEGFFARSYDEDCFIMGGGRQASTHRMEWESGVYAYVNGDRVLRVFGERK